MRDHDQAKRPVILNSKSTIGTNKIWEISNPNHAYFSQHGPIK